MQTFHKCVAGLVALSAVVLAQCEHSPTDADGGGGAASLDRRRGGGGGSGGGGGGGTHASEGASSDDRFAPGAFDQDSESPHIVFGFPRGHDEADHAAEIDYAGFSVGYDAEVLAPRWTFMKVTARSADANSAMRRPGRFKTDPKLKSRGLAITVHDDYNNPPDEPSRWDRGHMVPFDDARGWGTAAGNDSFYTSNIVPQVGELNRGAWLHLEQSTTQYARDHGVVWVATGPVYARAPKPFAEDRKVPAPKALYKIVMFVTAEHSLVALAWVLPNEPLPHSANLAKYRVTVDDVESRTGLDFFPDLDDDDEDAMESNAHKELD